MTPPTKQIETVWSNAIKQIDTMIKRHMMDVARKWQHRYPNHTIRWLDAMGMAGFQINGEWIAKPDHLAGKRIWGSGQKSRSQPEVFQTYEDVYSSGERALHRILAPLFDVMGWYADMVDNCGQQVGCREFQIGPRSAREELARKKLGLDK